MGVGREGERERERERGEMNGRVGVGREVGGEGVGG